MHWPKPQNPSPTAHVCEFLAAAFEVIAVFGLNGILDGRGHGVVSGQDGALHELDLTGHAALEAASCSCSTTGLLALSPGLGGARLAPLVWGRRALSSAKLSSRLVATRGRVDIRTAMSLGRVLGRAIGRICLCQTVGRMRAVIWVTVEGVVVGACRIFVQERATDLVLIVPSRSVLSTSLTSTANIKLTAPRCRRGERRRGLHALRCYGHPHSFAGCTP